MYLTSESLAADQPNNCEVTLWKHQLIMLNRCLEIEKHYDIGIISDQPGSGKTYVVLALINHIYDNNRFVSSLSYGSETKTTNLIVVTNNIYHQWLEAIQQFPNLSYHKFIDYQDISSLYYGPDILKKYDILLTTPLYFNMIAQSLRSNNLSVHRLVIDEIDNTSSLILNNIDCQYKWFVSGSFNPEMTGCYRSTLDNIDRLYGDLSVITCCCEPSLYGSEEILEEPLYHDVLCKDIYIDFIMDGIISEEEKCALNALDFKVLLPEQGVELKATNFQGLLKKMTENFQFQKSHLSDKISSLEVSKNRLLVMQELEKFHCDQDGLGSETSVLNHQLINNKLMVISQQQEDALNQQTLNSEKLDRVANRLQTAKVCTICYEALEDDIYTTECCQSLYCQPCITRWLETLRKKTCPFCQQKICFKDHRDKTTYPSRDYLGIDRDYYSDSDRDSVSDSDSDIDNTQYNQNNETKQSNQSNQPKVYSVFMVVDVDKYKTTCQDKKKQKLDSLYQSHQEKMSILNQQFDLRKKKLEQDQLQEIQENIRIQENEKRQTEEAQIRFLEIKKQQEEYRLKTTNMLSKIDYIKTFLTDIDQKRDRIIIFSDFSSIFKQITEYLVSINLGHVTLDGGNINDLQSDIDDYRLGNRPVLMANSSMYGWGMNLQHTTHILLVHKISCPLKREQLISRAQRPGRTCRLKIYTLLHRNEQDKGDN